MDVYFTRSFYKQLLGLNVCFGDLEDTDKEFYDNLSRLREMQLKGVFEEQTFSEMVDVFGKLTTVDLIPDGRNI